MRYGVYFACLGALCLWLAVATQGVAWSMLWPAASLFLVSGAYLGNAPGLFGKASTGRASRSRTLVLLPYLALLWGVWTLARWLSREPASHVYDANLQLGRRPLAGELGPEVTWVVDLTCEFAAAAGVAEGRAYRCLPTLDASVPPLRETLELLDELAGRQPMTLFVHCAQGHGRTGLFAAALLLHRGQAASPDEALEALRRCRPGIRLRASQRRFLQQLAAALAARAEPVTQRSLQ